MSEKIELKLTDTQKKILTAIGISFSLIGGFISLGLIFLELSKTDEEQ